MSPSLHQSECSSWRPAMSASFLQQGFTASLLYAVKPCRATVRPILAVHTARSPTCHFLSLYDNMTHPEMSSCQKRATPSRYLASHWSQKYTDTTIVLYAFYNIRNSPARIFLLHPVPVTNLFPPPAPTPLARSLRSLRSLRGFP